MTNDTHGHDAGDVVYAPPLNDLRRTVTDDDFVGRWGGGRIRGARRSPCHVLGSRRPGSSSALRPAVPAGDSASSGPIGASIGVVEVHPSDQRTADQILREADLAMYDAKRARR